MSEPDVGMVLLSTDDVDASIAFYEKLGFTLTARDGDSFAELNAGCLTVALEARAAHPIPGQVLVGVRTDDVDFATRVARAGGAEVLRAPYDDATVRRAVVYDPTGNGLVLYCPLAS